MALRQIRYETDELLRKTSREVKEITPSIVTLIDDMIETMESREGVGLAAPQVGILRRIITVDVEEGKNPIALINPEILESSGTQTNSEACLSLPKRSGKVIRPSKIKVKYTNRDGEETVLDAKDLLAVAICHEVDHLNGILYIDKVISMDDPADMED